MVKKKQKEIRHKIPSHRSSSLKIRHSLYYLLQHDGPTLKLDSKFFKSSFSENIARKSARFHVTTI